MSIVASRRKGARLDSEAFRAHLDALVGETARHVAAHATYDRAAIQTPSELPARAWRASEPVDGTPGVLYLSLSPREQRRPSDRPGAVQGAKRRSEPGNESVHERRAKLGRIDYGDE